MEAYEKTAALLLRIREKRPLIHQITNYVTANDCANITLAIGASPVMADDINEVKEITTASSALVINLGTLNEQKLEAMLAAGAMANEIGVPVVLDPVGVSATLFRLEAARRILQSIKLAVIRGNLAEIKALYGLKSKSRGVDSLEILGADAKEATEASFMARELAISLGASIAITGVVDLITDGKKLIQIANGNPMMARVTGTGCMCSSLIGAYLGAGGTGFDAAVAGVISMGVAGEMAYDRLNKAFQGSGSLKVYLLDAIYRLDSQDILERGKIYET